MADISRGKLYGKLNAVARRSIEAATTFCKLRSNPTVEMVHWLHQILQLQDSDLHRILRHTGLDLGRIATDFQAALDQLPRGASTISDFSGHLDDATEKAWSFATLVYGEAAVRTGHLLVAMLKNKPLRNVLVGLSAHFGKLKPDDISDRFSELTDGSPEQGSGSVDGSRIGGGEAPGEATGAMPAAVGKLEALKAYASNLTEKARKGEMDPILGRDDEIRQVVDILLRRRQNNPILTGEAGVGKTAVAEGLAQYIVRGLVPPALKDVDLYNLDLGLLQAGASMKGEFEDRLRRVIEEVQSSPKPIILFIDEAHTLIGAGGAEGSGDAANLLKPALARGKLRTVAATTWMEYKKYFEKDPALTRRFQVVKVDEPSVDQAIVMLRGLVPINEKHHRVQVLDEALIASVKLSNRYIPARQLPDKAVSLLDTACARVAISQHAVPAQVDDTRRVIEALATEKEVLESEVRVGLDHTERLGEIATKLAAAQERLATLEANWKVEKELVDRILDLRGKLRKAGEPLPPAETGDPTGHVPSGQEKRENPASPGLMPPAERDALFAELKELQAKLKGLQGESPLILPAVDETAVAAVVADWTGVPVGRMVKNEIEAVLNLTSTMNKRVLGQDHALEVITRRLKISRASLENPTRPIGVFLLVGPSGVGKTETALALAETLYGGEQNLITINMSEYQESSSVTNLKGSAKGLVGYGEGGVLTEAVRIRPYSVVLLDEIEKAHKDVHLLFFQVFDKGSLEDSTGRLIDFKNTIILITSNVGSELIMNLCKDPELQPDPESIAKALREPLLKTFPAALLGRVTVVPYYPLSDDLIRKIIRHQLGKVGKRIKEGHDVPFTYDDAVVDTLAARCTELESGVRMIEAVIMNNLVPAISQEILVRLMEERPIGRVHVGVKDSQFTYDFG
jgi:type VI secretion system protein VasG